MNERKKETNKQNKRAMNMSEYQVTSTCDDDWGPTPSEVSMGWIKVECVPENKRLDPDGFLRPYDVPPPLARVPKAHKKGPPPLEPISPPVSQSSKCEASSSVPDDLGEC